MTTDITIQGLLDQLDPSGLTRSRERAVSRTDVWFTGFEESAHTFVTADLFTVLQALPVGCPVAEGEDGSLWETLIELDTAGVDKALAYIAEHHGATGA